MCISVHIYSCYETYVAFKNCEKNTVIMTIIIIIINVYICICVCVCV